MSASPFYELARPQPTSVAFSIETSTDYASPIWATRSGAGWQAQARDIDITIDGDDFVWLVDGTEVGRREERPTLGQAYTSSGTTVQVVDVIEHPAAVFWDHAQIYLIGCILGVAAMVLLMGLRIGFGSVGSAVDRIAS